MDPTLLQRSFWSGFEITIADVYASRGRDGYIGPRIAGVWL